MLLELDHDLIRIKSNQKSFPGLHAIWNEQFIIESGCTSQTSKLCPRTIREIIAYPEAFGVHHKLLQFADMMNMSSANENVLAINNDNQQMLQYLDYDTIGKHNVTLTYWDNASTDISVNFTTHIRCNHPIVAPQITVDQLICNVEQPKIEPAIGNFWALLNGEFADEDLIADIRICEILHYKVDSELYHTTLVNVSGHLNQLIELCTKVDSSSIIMMFTSTTIYDQKYIGGMFNVLQCDPEDYIFNMEVPTFESLIIDAAVRGRHLTRREFMPHVPVDHHNNIEVLYWITKPDNDDCDTKSFYWDDFSSWFNPAMIRRRELIAKLTGIVNINFETAPIEQLEKLATIF